MVSSNPDSPDAYGALRDVQLAAMKNGADHERQKDLVIVRHDEWHAHFWWDFVPSRVRVRFIGNYRQAGRDWKRWTDNPDIHRAVDQEVERLDLVPWGSQPLPGKKKERKRTTTTETIETKNRLTFGDLPLGWRKSRKKK